MINIPGHEPPTMHEYEDSWCISAYNPTTTTTTTTVPNLFVTHSPTWTTRFNNNNNNENHRHSLYNHIYLYKHVFT